VEISIYIWAIVA